MGRLNGKSSHRNVQLQDNDPMMQESQKTFLVYVLGLGYHDDLLTRAVFMEVLTKILQQV